MSINGKLTTSLAIGGGSELNLRTEWGVVLALDSRPSTSETVDGSTIYTWRGRLLQAAARKLARRGVPDESTLRRRDHAGFIGEPDETERDMVAELHRRIATQTIDMFVAAAGADGAVVLTIDQ